MSQKSISMCTEAHAADGLRPPFTLGPIQTASLADSFSCTLGINSENMTGIGMNQVLPSFLRGASVREKSNANKYNNIHQNL